MVLVIILVPNWGSSNVVAIAKAQEEIGKTPDLNRGEDKAAADTAAGEDDDEGQDDAAGADGPWKRCATEHESRASN